MDRRFLETVLSICVVLLMFGTATLADDSPEGEVIFDLSAAFEKTVPVSDSLTDVQMVGLAEESAEPTPAVPSQAADAPPGTTAGKGSVILDEVPPTSAPVVDEGFSLWRRPAPTYPLPSRSFSVFQSPVSYGWGFFERCAPTPFKPRGDGIPKRTSCFRMDYRPYTLKNTESAHGPAFYQRFELYPCEECHHHGKHLQRRYGLR